MTLEYIVIGIAAVIMGFGLQMENPERAIVALLYLIFVVVILQC